MSGSKNREIKRIFDKNKIYRESFEMLQELRELRKINNEINNAYFENKYTYLFTNFKQIYDMVYEDPANHDVLVVLRQMLLCADQYHTGQMSFDKSSKIAGEILFNKFYHEKKKEEKK